MRDQEPQLVAAVTPPDPRFTTADDVALVGRHLLTAGAPRASVVVVHGFTASSEHPDVVAVAETLHAHDLDVVWYDARGHGRSEGLSTLGDLEYHDVAAAVTWSAGRAERVVLVGASMGAIAALRYAAFRDDIAGVVIVSCPAGWRLPRSARGVLAAGLTRTRVGRALAARYLNVRVAPRWTTPLPPTALVPRLTVPLAIVHGDADRFIAPADARELAALAQSPCRLEVVPGMGHALDPLATPAIIDAVEWALAQ